MKDDFISNRLKLFTKLIKARSLLVLVCVIILFNFLSTIVLPKELLIVYAANIDVNELIALSNSERISRGLDPLVLDCRLIAAAKKKGEDMFDKDYWAHYGPNGETPWQFILASGYEYLSAGENLAKDFTSAAPIHSAWMDSPSHRSNIINPSFTNIGIAYVTGEFQGKETTIVVQIFGSTESSYSQLEEEDIKSTETLPFIEEGELEAPIIIYPEDGDILNNGAFTIKGQTSEGDFIEVYDNGQHIGKTGISSSVFNFKRKEKYNEGKHVLHTRSEDNDGRLSKVSDSATIIVDTIVPRILKDTLNSSYTEIDESSKEIQFKIKIEDNPTTVQGKYKDEYFSFIINEGEWIGSVLEDGHHLEELSIVASDTAGNFDGVSYSSEEVLNSVGDQTCDFVKASNTSSKWIVENVVSRMFTRSLRGQINFIIAFAIAVLLIIEQVALARTGFTRGDARPFLHLPIFIILLFVGIIGGGGEIL